MAKNSDQSVIDQGTSIIPGANRPEYRKSLIINEDRDRDRDWRPSRAHCRKR